MHQRVSHDSYRSSTTLRSVTATTASHDPKLEKHWSSVGRDEDATRTRGMFCEEFPRLVSVFRTYQNESDGMNHAIFALKFFKLHCPAS